MATLGGSGSGSVVAYRARPVAILAADPEVGVLGTVVRVDATQTTSPNDLALTYTWSFDATPVGSKVSIEGFRLINPDASIASFSPDVTGAYTTRVTVSDGVYSSTATIVTTTQAILVPDGTGLVPDGKFIWSYIRDVWQQADNRQVFETLWSALLQIVGSELLKLYQVDFNKSIRDIQEKFQRRWLCYEPRLDIDTTDMSAFIGLEMAGTSASTEILGSSGKAVIVTRSGSLNSELLVIEGTVSAEAVSPLRIMYSKDPAQSNVGSYDLAGLNADHSGYRLTTTVPYPDSDLVHDGSLQPIFAFQSTSWSFGTTTRKDYALVMSEWSAGQDQLLPTYQPMAEMGSDLGGALVGDVIVVKTGVNAGIYRITEIAGSYVTVDRKPPNASDTARAEIRRPVGYSLPPSAQVVTNTLAIPLEAATADLTMVAPGRILSIGSRGYTVLRTYTDPFQGVTLAIISTDDGEIVAWQKGVAWRIPNCLVSTTQDFEALGVRPGDLLAFDVTDSSKTLSVTIKARVVAVDRKRLGFELSLDPTVAGVVPPVPDSLFAEACNGLNIYTATYSARDGLLTTDAARELWTYLHGTAFKTNYWNKSLLLTEGLNTPLGMFYVTPRYIIRNSLIPVDETLLEVPVLQEWIKQPEVAERDGKYYLFRNGKEYESNDPPIQLYCNSDYVIDGQTAVDDTFVYKAGTDVLDIEGARFIDLRVAQGDVLTVHDPAGIAGDYKIAQVLDQERLRLVKPIPQGVAEFTTSRMSIIRRKGGTYLRCLPGLFDANNPLPGRLWAEVSYFDNSDAIEDNFGILVGLRKKDLEGLQKDLSYRQAVSGLMYAYSQGSSLSRVRLGAQILLGLPFAEQRGIIRSIDEDYRLDTYGNPLQGRILVEDVDQLGVAQGIQRIYLYPIDAQSQDLAGVETSPVSGLKYAVGDTVEQFAPLAKGVTISDYLSDPDAQFMTAAATLQKFHTFRLRVNDQIFGVDEIQLVSEFLRRITPSYVSFILSISSELVDTVSIEDQIFLKLLTSHLALGDNPGLGLPAAFRFDDQDFNGHALGQWGVAIRHRRASGQQATLSNASQIITVPGGLLVSGGSEGAPCRIGDTFVLLDGPYAGPYEITDLTDTAATVTGPMGGFKAGVYPYFVYRPLQAEIRRGEIQAVATEFVAPDPVPSGWKKNSTFTLETGLIGDGVMPGDWIVVDTGSVGVRFTISSVAMDGVHDSKVVVLPADGAIQIGQAYRIYRPSFIPSANMEAEAVVLGLGLVTFTDNFFEALLDSRDELQFATEGLPNLFVIGHTATAAYCVPSVPLGTYTVKLCKTFHDSAPVGFSWLANFNIHDTAKLTITSALLAETEGSGYVILDEDTLGAIRIGDVLRITSGTNALLDIGYGPGYFPIVGMRGAPRNDVLVPSTLAPETDVEWELIKYLGTPLIPIRADVPAGS
jgi:hypothetical protein